jgi:myo-inositol-1(or 4)-monophosphatase
MEYQSFILNSLHDAAILASGSHGNVIGKTKGSDNNQVLTETDLAIGNLLIAKINETYPNHNIIDEEAGVVDKKSPFTWVVDPIDGTSNFAEGLPMYGIMIGLLKEHIPIAGGVFLPFFHEIYFAEQGKGAFCNGKKIHVTQENDLEKVLAVYMIDSHRESPNMTDKESRLVSDIVLHIRNLRTSGSCFDDMMVAKGKYGAVMNLTSKIWDNVAPQIIITEAGGLYTDVDGNTIDYSDPLKKIDKNFTYCAAPYALHVQLQEIIKRHNLEVQ